MKTKKPELDESETAKQVGVTKATLANWRWRGDGPAYLKIGRTVVYLQADIDEWKASQRVSPVAAWTKTAS